FYKDIGYWDVSNMTDMSYMFYNAISFNQDIGNWDVSSVTDMGYMFYDQYIIQDAEHSFNQDIGNWDVSNVTRMTGMFYNVTLSTANYDALLTGWINYSLQNNVHFSGGNSKYSSASQSARNILTDVYSWSIYDGGVED
ncbi:MAG: BspA family leucine-rich repeat surface protein, partial [Colwellia sp.]|nr:BspA family leucine-rich repeat surface protein [Colwellia sp.]